MAADRKTGECYCMKGYALDPFSHTCVGKLGSEAVCCCLAWPGHGCQHMYCRAIPTPGGSRDSQHCCNLANMHLSWYALLLKGSSCLHTRLAPCLCAALTRWCALLCCGVAWCAEDVRRSVQSQSSMLSRRLTGQSTVVCPPGCDVAAVDTGEPQRCTLEGTGTDGYRCAKCLNSLLLNLETGTCGCVAGYYTPAGTTSCVDCDKGHWCAGGRFYGLSDPKNPAAVPCPLHDDAMTTAGLRSKWENHCGKCLRLLSAWCSGLGYEHAVDTGPLLPA
jgi:hypothetical protein